MDIYFSNLVSTSATRVPPARARSWAPRCSYSAKALRLRAKPSRPTSSRATWRGNGGAGRVRTYRGADPTGGAVSFRSPSPATHTLHPNDESQALVNPGSVHQGSREREAVRTRVTFQGSFSGLTSAAVVWESMATGQAPAPGQCTVHHSSCRRLSAEISASEGTSSRPRVRPSALRMKRAYSASSESGSARSVLG